MRTRITINRHIIRANKDHGRDDPPISVQTYKGVQRARSVSVEGPSRIVYSPEKPLKCGATVWIECEGEVSIQA